MKFKPTLWKVIVSLIIGFVLGFLNYKILVYGTGLKIENLISIWAIASIVSYIIWSLIQKKK